MSFDIRSLRARLIEAKKASKDEKGGKHTLDMFGELPKYTAKQDQEKDRETLPLFPTGCTSCDKAKKLKESMERILEADRKEHELKRGVKASQRLMHQAAKRRARLQNPEYRDRMDREKVAERKRILGIGDKDIKF